MLSRIIRIIEVQPRLFQEPMVYSLPTTLVDRSEADPSIFLCPEIQRTQRTSGQNRGRGFAISNGTGSRRCSEASASFCLRLVKGNNYASKECRNRILNGWPDGINDRAYKKTRSKLEYVRLQRTSFPRFNMALIIYARFSNNISRFIRSFSASYTFSISKYKLQIIYFE